MRKRMSLLAMMFLAIHSFSAYGYEAESGMSKLDITQQKRIVEVTGTVSDAQGAIIGATVLVKNDKSKGTITDIDGNFKMQIPVGTILVISYVGYENKEVAFKGEKHLNVSLNDNVMELGEVQVIAYGSAKKVTITGAMSSVNSSDILKAPTGSITNALAGKMTGFSSVQASGQPGEDDPTIYVRGVGSLSASMSTPLTLVDGIERPFSQLDPNEIENITVLKDASATAVFGVRGANGVIIVTTKRGQEGKAQIDFSTSFGLQMPSGIPKFANSLDYATTYREAQLHDGVPKESLTFTDNMVEEFRTKAHPLAYPDTDWVKLILRNAAIQTQHNFNVSGGSKAVRYFASLGVLTQDGLFRTFENNYDSSYKYDRYNYRVNLDIAITKTTQMRLNMDGRLNNKRTPNFNNGTSTNVQSIFLDVYQAPPFAGAGIVDGKRIIRDKKIFSNLGSTFYDAFQNTYGKGYTINNGNTLNFDFALEQKLDMLTKGLKMHLKGAYNSGLTQVKRWTGSGELYEAVVADDGSVGLNKTSEQTTLYCEESFEKSRNWYFELAANYQRDFGLHHVSGLVMYNQSKTYYPRGAWPGIPRSYIGLVGRATYDYNTRYMADFSIGYNGSENFAKGKRFGMFPAGSIGWIISEEKFMKILKPYLDYLKIRASYGLVGNDKTSDDSRFLYLPDKYGIWGSGVNFGVSTPNYAYGGWEDKKGNPDVTWETAAKQNYGVDLYMFDSRLKTTFDYFIEHRQDILTSRKVLPGYLAVSLPTANIGKVDNKGYEISVKWEDNFKKINYYIGFNLSYAKNKIIFMDEIDYPYDYMKITGKPVGQQFGYKYDGYFSEEDVATYLENRGKTVPKQGDTFIPKAGDVKYKDLNGDMVIDDLDIAAIGNPLYPLLTGGINMGFSYKGFDLSMTWSGATKTSKLLGKFYREPFGDGENKALLQYMIDDAWTPEKGNSAKAPAISFSSKGNNYSNSDLWLRDASYLRLKNIEIGYSLSANLLKKMGMRQFRVFASGYNLLTFDKLKIQDPEASSEYPLYPNIKIVNIGVKFGF